MAYGQTKYITYQDVELRDRIAVFSYEMKHIDMEVALRRYGDFYSPLGAGFVVNGKCEGISESMRLKSRPVEDTALLKQLTGL
jgi:hypothetical protein